MMRYLMLILLVFGIFVVAVLFAAANPGEIELDLAFTRLQMNKSLAFVSVFAAGWLVGMLCIGLLLLRLLGERRQLRRSLRLAEAEVANLRRIPLRDAD